MLLGVDACQRAVPPGEGGVGDAPLDVRCAAQQGRPQPCEQRLEPAAPTLRQRTGERALGRDRQAGTGGQRRGERAGHDGAQQGRAGGGKRRGRGIGCVGQGRLHHADGGDDGRRCVGGRRVGRRRVAHSWAHRGIDRPRADWSRADWPRAHTPRAQRSRAEHVHVVEGGGRRERRHCHRGAQRRQHSPGPAGALDERQDQQRVAGQHRQPYGLDAPEAGQVHGGQAGLAVAHREQRRGERAQQPVPARAAPRPPATRAGTWPAGRGCPAPGAGAARARRPRRRAGVAAAARSGTSAGVNGPSAS